MSAVEGGSDSDIDERSTLRADRYIVDPDQPKLALAEESFRPTSVEPPPPGEEYHGELLFTLIKELEW